MFLLFLCLGTADVNAQVRIGGNTAPQGAAVLDLNADNTATPAGNKGALALPRVSLASATAQLNGTTPITGMLVYNTNATLGAGIYVWSGSSWVMINGGNGLMDTIAGGGLNKTGAGTTANPYKVGIKTGGVTTGMIADTAITNAKVAPGIQSSKITTGIAANGVPLYSVNSTLSSPGGLAVTVDSSYSFSPKSVNVSWTIVLDTTIDLSKYTTPRIMLYVPNLLLVDLCFTRDWPGARSVYVEGIHKMIHILPGTMNMGQTYMMPLRCYRPTAI